MDTKLTLPCMLFVLCVILLAGCGSDEEEVIPPPIHTSEGSAAQPVPLNVGSPHNGSIAPGGTSYYAVTPNNAVPHLFRVGGDEGTTYGTEVYASGDFQTNLLVACLGIGDSTLPESCAFTPAPAGAIHSVKVTESFGFGQAYTVGVYENTATSEGSPAAPIPVTTGTPYVGTVGGSAASYYSFTPATTGARTIVLSNFAPIGEGSIWPIVWFSGFSNVLIDCAAIRTVVSGTVSCTTPSLTGSTPYGLAVTNGDPLGGPFTLSVTP